MLSQFAFLIMHFIGSGNRNIYYCQSGRMDVTFSEGKFGSLSNFRTLLVLAFSQPLRKFVILYCKKRIFVVQNSDSENWGMFSTAAFIPLLKTPFIRFICSGHFFIHFRRFHFPFQVSFISIRNVLSYN